MVCDGHISSQVNIRGIVDYAVYKGCLHEIGGGVGLLTGEGEEKDIALFVLFGTQSDSAKGIAEAVEVAFLFEKDIFLEAGALDAILDVDAVRGGKSGFSDGRKGVGMFCRGGFFEFRRAFGRSAGAGQQVAEQRGAVGAEKLPADGSAAVGEADASFSVGGGQTGSAIHCPCGRCNRRRPF